MNPLYIVNDFDAPCERLIAELRGESLFYIHPEMQKDWANRGMNVHNATLLESFSVFYHIEDGLLHGSLRTCTPTATYRDGRPRRWQGSKSFSFPYPPKPVNTPFNVLDALDKPDDVGADEYRSIYEALDMVECAFDPEMAMAVCEEFKHWAQHIIDKLEATLLEPSGRE